MPIAFEPGSIIAGKYRVERVLGQGGMGLVLRARHLQLDEPVAIKVPLPGVLASKEAVARFLREARAAVRISTTATRPTSTRRARRPTFVAFTDGARTAHRNACSGAGLT